MALRRIRRAARRARKRARRATKQVARAPVVKQAVKTATPVVKQAVNQVEQTTIIQTIKQVERTANTVASGFTGILRPIIKPFKVIAKTVMAIGRLFAMTIQGMTTLPRVLRNIWKFISDWLLIVIIIFTFVIIVKSMQRITSYFSKLSNTSSVSNMTKLKTALQKRLESGIGFGDPLSTIASYYATIGSTLGEVAQV